MHFLYHPEDEEEEEYDTKSLDEVVANYIDPEMVASYNCEVASHIVDFYAAAIVASYNAEVGANLNGEEELDYYNTEVEVDCHDTEVMVQACFNGNLNLVNFGQVLQLSMRVQARCSSSTDKAWILAVQNFTSSRGPDWRCSVFWERIG